MNRDDFCDFSRREFVRLATLAAGLAALPACGSDKGACADAAAVAASSSALPGLGGAPDTPDGRVIAAFVDTIVPGKHRDPTCAPGGIDVGAPALFFDPELPALPFVPALVLVLDNVAQERFGGRRFLELVPAERDQVVARAQESIEVMELAIQLAKLAYYSSPQAAAHLGYPGPNTGYWDHEDFSFGRKLTREITPDGNFD